MTAVRAREDATAQGGDMIRRSACAAACDVGPLVDRRDFILRAALAAASVALAACGADSATAPFSAVLTANGSPIAVVRTGTATFLALSRICPHQGGTIGVSGTGFMCPVHGARFSSTGTWTGGQVTSNMRSYATNYDPSTGILTIG